MKLEKIEMSEGSRMLRVGFGQNNFRCFFRVDLWWIGFRVSKE